MSEKSGSSVLKSAGAMGIAVFLSRILGLVREQVFAAMFGASTATDAYQIAFRIPNLLRDLFAEGAMSAALVPTFIRVQKEEGESRGWQVATRVFGVLFATVSVISVLGILFAEPLVALYAGAFRNVPGKFELTVSMTRIMMPFFPLVALAAAFMAILNAAGKFFIPSFASALFNVVSILTGVVLAGFFEQPIEGMAWGVVAGGFIQALIQWPVLLKVGYRPQWSQPLESHGFRDPALIRMMGLMIPGTVGLAATQINILVNSIFATSVGEGAVSWLNYSFRLMQFPIGVFGVSLASATLPAFSRHWSAREPEQAVEVLRKSIRRVFAVNFPASAGLAFLGVPILSLIFEHGKFSPIDTLNTAHALAAYSVGLTAYSVVKVLVPVCYAMGETRIAVISSFFSVGVNLMANFLLVDRLGFTGLALGTSLTALLNASLLWFWIGRRLADHGVGVPGSDLLRAGTKCLIASLTMGVAVWALDQLLISNLNPSNPAWFRAVRVAIGVSAGVGVYAGISILTGIEETLELLDLFKRRWSRGKR
jgi:putative peptidoglycan lipid II flippase